MAVRRQRNAHCGKKPHEGPQETPQDTQAVQGDGPTAPAPPEDAFPVVGVGASAGGLEAFSQVLEALPEGTRAAFVFIQHLDPRHESMLVPLLSRAARIPVLEAHDGQKVEPGHVYVAPPGVSVAIAGGHLKLERADSEVRRLKMPIDLFFRSLAHEQGNHSIGVILSGTGTDGTLGLQEIKEWGGLALVEDTKTAKFAGMPQSAIAHTAVDAVLPPGEIARTLARLAKHPYVARGLPVSQADEPAGDGLRTVFRLLHAAHRVDFANYKESTMLRRTTRRMALLGLADPDTYSQYCRSHPGELTALYHDLLIKVTAFFRDPDSFEALKAAVFPVLFQDRPATQPVRIWVPGCATGEEAYSVAITLFEWLDAQGITALPIRIFATDVDETALATGRTGIYLENIAMDISPERLERFFIRTGNTYQVIKHVREACTFARHDLLRDPPFSSLDLISCRNLLMYLGPSAQQPIIANFHYALQPKGFLMLGTSETVGAASELFPLADSKNKIYTRQAAEASARVVAAGPAFYRNPREPFLQMGFPEGQGGHRPRAPEEADIYREADRAVLGYYAPAGVLVNERLDILQFRGDTGHYLLPSPGAASLNLLNMAREGLLTELRAATETARKTGEMATRAGAAVTYEGALLDVTVRVMPVRPREGGASRYLVLFEEPGRPVAPPRPSRQRGEAASKHQTSERQIRQLRQELEATKEYLQSAIEDRDAANEELKSANEEILSANEELQSSNEELETSKEELESSNEELTTANEEMERRYRELIGRTDDLHNLFDSGHVPIIHLDQDLRLRQFSNAAREVLNVIPTDAGRPITDLRLHIEVPNLERLLRRVIATGQTVEREVQAKDAHWYLLRMRPYRTLEGATTGAVMILIDIESVKGVERLTRLLEERERTQALVKEALQYVEDVIATYPEPFLVLGGDLRVLDANETFYEMFQLSRGDAVGRRLTELGNGQWDMPELQTRLAELVAENHPFRDFEVTHTFPTIGERTVLFSGRRVQRVHLPALRDRILLAIRDITERERAKEALRLSEERLRKVLDTDAVGALFFDARTGTLIDANNAFLRLMGYTRQEVEAGMLDWRKMTPPEYVEASLGQLERLEATGRIGPYEKQYLCKDGSRRLMLFTGASLGDGTNVEFCVDLTEQERLREAGQRKDEFLAMLSHELRNPLAAIHLAVELFRISQGNQSMQREALDVLQHQVTVITRLVDDLLEVSRVTRGKIQLHEADVDLRDVVQRAVQTVHSQLAERRQEVPVSLPESPLRVHGDAVRLEQVVVNLLSNATKYTPVGGHIRVGVAREEQQAVLRVRDSGKGITPEEFPHIFELFWQGEQPLARTQGGLGIGLPLVKGLVELHGGTVTAASEGRGKGAEFVVRLPAVAHVEPRQAEPPAEARPQATDIVQRAAGKLRVLVVDDQHFIADQMTSLLRAYGHEVQTAYDGPSALRAAPGFRPDVVLLDIGLPGMDGYEVARRLRQEEAPRDTVLVAMTGYGQEDDRRRSREAGFDHHLLKPADFQSTVQPLLAKIAEGRTA